MVPIEPEISDFDGVQGRHALEHCETHTPPLRTVVRLKVSAQGQPKLQWTVLAAKSLTDLSVGILLNVYTRIVAHEPRYTAATVLLLWQEVPYQYHCHKLPSAALIRR